MKKAALKPNIIFRAVQPAILIFLLSFFPISCFATHYIDSLISIVNSYGKSDTTEVKLFIRIASCYRNRDLDSTVYYANKGLQLAEQLNFDKGKANCKHDLGLVYLRRNKDDSALEYYREALRIYEKINDKTSECQVLRAIGDIYCRQSKTDSAIKYNNKSAEISKETNNYMSLGLSYIDIAGIYSDQNNYIEAINYFLEGLKAFEAAKSNEDISNTLVNIGTLYSAMGNYKKATEYINKGLAIHVTDREIIFTNCVNSGSVYSQMKDYTTALTLFKRALTLAADSIGDIAWTNICLENIADVYYSTGRYDTAYTLYREVLKHNNEIKDTIVLATAKTAVGSILIKSGKLEEGIKELREALQIAQNKSQKQTVLDASRELAGAYENLHDYKQALYYHKIYYNYSDTLYNEKTNKRVLQLQFDYDLGKKEGQIALLSKDKEIQEGKNARQKIAVLALASGVLLLCIISVLLYRYSMAEKRNKERIMVQKEEIQEQALRLEELNRFKDKTFSVLSHDLRGPLGSVTATIKMLDQDLLTTDEFTEMKPEVNRQLRSLNILLDNLLQWAKNYIHGHTSANPGKVNLQKATMFSIELLGDTATLKEINIVNNISADIDIFFDPDQFQIICRNIIMNALKFTPHGGNIKLNAVAAGDMVNFSIADNGVGMTQEQAEKLFTTSTENPTYGTDGEKGTGLGLLLCYEFIKANNSFISVKSEPGKGTMFNLELPLKTA